MRTSIVAIIAASSYLSVTSAATICGSKGYDDGTDSYYDDGQGTYTGCSAACTKSSKCKSFAYGSGECYLYNVPVQGNFEQDKTSPYTFYDASCAKPSSSTTATTTTTTTTKKSSSSTTTTLPTPTTTKSSSTTITTSTKPPTSTPSLTTSTLKPTTSTTTSPFPSSTCPVDQRPSCTGQELTDPCSQGCGCLYVEGCNGSIRPNVSDPNTVLARYFGVSYSTCVRTCDARQPECIGVNYGPDGSCYLYGSLAGIGPAPGAWYAYRNKCDKPCAHS